MNHKNKSILKHFQSVCFQELQFIEKASYGNKTGSVKFIAASSSAKMLFEKVTFKAVYYVWNLIFGINEIGTS